MKVTVEVSEETEMTSSPWWVIIDPAKVRGKTIESVADAFVGPFFSRQEAEEHLAGRRYEFSKRALVYCKSAYFATRYHAAHVKATKRRYSR